MAKVGIIKRFNLEDYPEKDFNKEKFFGAINGIITTLGNALQGSLTFGENFNAQVKTIGFTYTANTFPMDIAITTKTKPLGAILLNIYEDSSNPADITTARDAQFKILDKTLRVQTILGLTNNLKYNMTILIIGS